MRILERMLRLRAWVNKGRRRKGRDSYLKPLPSCFVTLVGKAS
jgi:hypothetical protein